MAVTLTISASGAAVLPASAPPQWPSNKVVWPAGGNPNGSKTVTISDADWISLITWAAAVNYANHDSPDIPVATPTAAQILLQWINGMLSATKTGVQRYMTPNPIIPPQITMT